MKNRFAAKSNIKHLLNTKIRTPVCLVSNFWLKNSNAQKRAAASFSSSNCCNDATLNTNLHEDVRRHEEGGLVLFDSLSQSYKQVGTDKFKQGIAWYTCGPTVYDSGHLGHARTYVCLDFLHRALLHLYEQQPLHQRSQKPIFIMNVTDIDDKILQRAREKNTSPKLLAKMYEQEFFQNLQALNVLPPSIVTRVSEHVEHAIIPYIERILKNNLAYVLSDTASESSSGDVYFDVTAFERSRGGLNKYGKLAPPSVADPLFFDREQNDRGKTELMQKRDPRDFCLWKQRKPDEDMYWNSPWGQGRPGWHIECSAMIDSTMLEFPNHKIFFHAGGIDLKFPHHTNEIAQAEAYRTDHNKHEPTKQEEWIPHWIHTGHLHIHGAKMSKSTKNFITIREYLQSSQTLSSPLFSPSDDFRLWCLGLSGHYRAPATYSETRILEARAVREKIVRFLVDGERWLLASDASSDVSNEIRKWGDADHLLVREVYEFNLAFFSAINWDFDGTSCLQQLIHLAEYGVSYLSSAKPGQHATEPLRDALSTLRQKLKLLGFSCATVEAGRYQQHRQAEVDEKDAFVNEIVRLRAAVRNIALEGLGGSIADTHGLQHCLKMILSVCDEVRDKRLPEMGVEVLDTKISFSDNDFENWRFCIPRKCDSLSSKTKRHKKSSTENVDVSVENFFRVGQYEGMFSEFDIVTGLPTKNMDGSNVSKALLAKLIKKRDKFKSKRRQ